MNKEYTGDKRLFIQIVVFAIILNMASMFDVWVTKNWLSVVMHFKSGLQTAALTLVIYALYMYYIEGPSELPVKL